MGIDKIPAQQTAFISNNKSAKKNTPIAEKSVELSAKNDVKTDSTCSESMVKEYNYPGFKNLFNGKISYSYYGKINEKCADLKEEFTKENVLGTKGHAKISGQIGGKSISYTQNNIPSLGKNEHIAEGNYDGKDFKLTFTTKFIGDATLTGIIDGQEINITFPSSEVPEDEATKDIITTLLMQNGYSVKIKNGEFKKLQLSKWHQRLNMETDLVIATANI